MNILITGSEGFVGKNLVESFRKKTNHAIFYPSYSSLDLTDIGAVEDYFKSHDFDVIIHSATTLRQKTDYPQDVCEKNLKMFFNILKFASKETKIINLGSGSEYSRAAWHEKMKETFFDTKVPMDGHSYAKYLISKFIEISDRKNITTFRIFGIYGKYEDYRFKFISNAIAKNIKKLPIVINQNVKFDYLYIEDFADILLNFMELKEFKYRAYNITPTNSVTLKEIAQIINEISEYKSEIIILNDGMGLTYSGDNSRLLESLNGYNFLSYEEGIRDLYQYYRSIEDEIDLEALKKDEYLSYAKKLKKDYVDRVVKDA